MLLFSFTIYAEALRSPLEVKQLRNLMNQVAAKGTELLTLTLATNATTETFLQMPTTIGNKQYWLQLRNDSTQSWLEGGFGNTPTQGTEVRVYLPKGNSATGSYKGGYGAVLLRCYVSAGVPQIFLSSSSEGD